MYCRLVVCLFHFASLFVQGQSLPNITVNLNEEKFQRLAEEVEKQSAYRFFFRSADVDSLRVTINVSGEPLNRVLDRVIDGTSVAYTIHDNNVYVTRGRQIMTSLPIDFFSLGITTTAESASFDYSDYEQREKQRERNEERLYVIGTKANQATTGEVTLTGIVTDERTGEAIIGASVFIEKTPYGVATDPLGHYTLKLPKGRQEIKIKSVGMKNTRRNVLLYNNGKLDIELAEDITPLKEVLVESERDVRVTGMQMGTERLDIRTMKQIPLALGETDIMKVVLTLPGVQTVGEGTVGLNVRGGATSQNLILFNDAVVYNPSHLFGFFSTFNPDVLKNVELYKSGINADYGGRLSSVMDVTAREGNLKKFAGSGGISPITGRLTLEGPIIKEKASVLVGLRSTYSDWILRQLDNVRFQRSNASFYDITSNVSWKVNDNNNLSLNAYVSQDEFRLNGDTTYAYSDRNGSLKWKHNFNKQLFSVFTGSFSQYKYNISSAKNPINAFTMDFSVRQYNAKADLTWFLTPKHTVTGGASTILYNLSPGQMDPLGDESLVVQNYMQQEKALESALYIGDNFEINPRTTVYFGARYSFFQNRGPRDVYQYLEGEPLQALTLVDTVHYGKGKSTASYNGFEPRVSARYILGRNASVKLSFNRLRQYIQMLSNTTAITPTDIWKLSDQYIRPQVGNQLSLGVYKNVRGNLIETSAEVYYKTIENTTDFKNGAVLLLNRHLETDVIAARGKAYGLELMVKKAMGRLNGWVSYTYSRSFLQTKGEFESETVNEGKYYPSNYDKPHAVNFIANYKFSRRLNFSMNTVYSTGRPITLPYAKYEIGGVTRIFYSERNQYRIPDYFRIDMSLNLEGNHKIRKLAHSSWTLAVYNLTGRHNAYSVFFVSQAGLIKGYKMSVFAQAIPTLTYNFKF